MQVASKNYADHNVRHQTPTRAFQSQSMKTFTESTRNAWNSGGESCRRYHGIMKRFTDAEREMMIKTTRKVFGKAHLMAVKEANKPATAPRNLHRMSSTTAYSVILDKRLDASSSFNESIGDSILKTRRNSLVRLSAPPVNQRQSTAVTSATSVKLPRVKSSLVLNSSLSLQDLSPQPKPNQLHLISSMSREAQYSMLRSYEQLIRDELLLLKMTHDLPDIVPSPITPLVVNGGENRDNNNQIFFSNSGNLYSSATLSYLITPFRSNEESDGFFRDQNNSQDQEASEIRKLKMSHFMEVAIKILNLIQSTRRLAERKNDPNYSRYYHDRLSSTTLSVFEDDDPFELFSRWAYLLNKEFKS